jgi:hypothetical protein
MSCSDVFCTDIEQLGRQLPIPKFIHEKIKLIESEDISILEDFFRSSFCNNAFAYTLFSSKPKGIIGHSWDFVDTSTTRRRQVRLMIDLKGWQVWQKYAHLFPSQNYCLINSELSDPTHLCFVIINKKRCQEVIKEHLSIFQECLGSQATISEIMDMVCSSKFGAYRNKKGYTTCLGLLFGYGKANSLGCERRGQLLIQALYRAPYHLEGLTEKMKNRQGYFHVGLQEKELMDNLEQPVTIQPVIEELNLLSETYKPLAFVDKDNLCPIKDFRCAGFIDDPETQTLKAQYESDYQRIVDIYNAENFLELILTQLSS